MANHAPILIMLQSKRNALIPDEKLRHDENNRGPRRVADENKQRRRASQARTQTDRASERKRDEFTCWIFLVDLLTDGVTRERPPISRCDGKGTTPDDRDPGAVARGQADLAAFRRRARAYRCELLGQ